MSRPKKYKKVCRLPKVNEFYPQSGADKKIIMTVDEYETIRLIDKEGFSQEECAGYMRVARTTVQQIYNTARTKIANAIVEGIGIRIEGGNYILCDGGEKECCCGGCNKHRNMRCNE